MNAELINEDDLKAWLGYTHVPQIEVWLRSRGIPFDYCRGKLVTTASAINGHLIREEKAAEGFQFA